MFNTFLNKYLNKGAELLTDHNLVVSWIRRRDHARQTWKNVVRVNWEHLVEALCPVGPSVLMSERISYTSQRTLDTSNISGPWAPSC